MPDKENINRWKDLPVRDGCYRQAPYPQFKPVNCPAKEDGPCVGLLELLIGRQLLLSSRNARFKRSKRAEDAQVSFDLLKTNNGRSVVVTNVERSW